MTSLIAAARSEALRAPLPAGRYMLGDPGMSMRTGLFQEAVEAQGDAAAAIVMVEGAPVVLMSARQGTYPNTGLLNLSAYDCDSCRIGLVHESLLVDSPDLCCLGSMVRVTGTGRLTVEDGLLDLADDVYEHLARVDTCWNRAARPDVAQSSPLAA